MARRFRLPREHAVQIRVGLNRRADAAMVRLSRGSIRKCDSTPEAGIRKQHTFPCRRLYSWLCAWLLTVDFVWKVLTSTAGLSW